jgi:hypothetical protein
MVDIAYKPTSEYNKDLVNNPITAPPRNNVFIVSSFTGTHITTSGNVLYEVTPGKNLYITGYNMMGTPATVIALIDTGEYKHVVNINADPPVIIQFNPPLRFVNEVKLKPSITGDFYFTLTGYEE